MVSIKEQSPDIALGVDKALEAKHGEMTDDADRGHRRGRPGHDVRFCLQRDAELMPLSIELAHKLCRRLAEVRKDGTLPYLRPDGKSQVTVEYAYGKPVRVDTIVISTQHSPDVDHDTDREGHHRAGHQACRARRVLDDDTKIYVNPTGRFVVGGPAGDSGLTGRKIIVDTYGGVARHGGGCFSGKDPTKVDRSAAYMAVCRQEPGGRRRGRPPGDPGQLRHWRGAAARASLSRPSARARSSDECIVRVDPRVTLTCARQPSFAT